MNNNFILRKHSLSIFLVSLILIGCGEKALGDYDILKNEGELSGQEIPIGTYDSKNIVFAYQYENSSFDSTELYVALDYETQSTLQSRRYAYTDEEYCVFFPELEEGKFKSEDGEFEYQASFDLETGTASEISEVVVLEGSATIADTAFIEGFLDNAAECVQDYLATYQEHQSRNEAWLVDTLEDLGYVLYSNYDRDGLDYMENKIFEDYGITVSVQKRYTGYINQSERFIEIIIFGNETQCNTYFYKVWSPSENQNYSYHARTENIYFFTSSFETIQATFPSAGNRP
jgi:hypothetical protein